MPFGVSGMEGAMKSVVQIFASLHNFPVLLLLQFAWSFFARWNMFTGGDDCWTRQPLFFAFDTSLSLA